MKRGDGERDESVLYEVGSRLRMKTKGPGASLDSWVQEPFKGSFRSKQVVGDVGRRLPRTSLLSWKMPQRLSVREKKKA